MLQDSIRPLAVTVSTNKHSTIRVRRVRTAVRREKEQAAHVTRFALEKKAAKKQRRGGRQSERL